MQIHINYGINSNNALLVACYHDRGQVGFGYAIEARLRNKDADKEDKFPLRTTLFPTSELPSKEDAGTELNKYLDALIKQIKVNKGIQVDKIILVADINLCTGNNNKIATYLITDELVSAYERKGILVERVLESNTPDLIEEAISYYSEMNSSSGAPVTIRTKDSCSKKFAKIFPADTQKEQEILRIRESISMEVELAEADLGDLAEGEAAEVHSGANDGEISNPTKAQAQTLSNISKPVKVTGLESQLANLEFSQSKDSHSQNTLR